MKIFTATEALPILKERCEYLEHHFPNHPANQKAAREYIYALRVAMRALEDGKKNWDDKNDRWDLILPMQPIHGDYQTPTLCHRCGNYVTETPTGWTCNTCPQEVIYTPETTPEKP